MRISEKINVLIFYYIKLLYKVLGVVFGIGATFRTGRFWYSPRTIADGRFFNARRLRAHLRNYENHLVLFFPLLLISIFILSL